MTDIKSMTQEELGSFLKSLGQPAFRAKQVFTWLHRGVTSFDEMTNLPKTRREQLAQKAQPMRQPTCEEMQTVFPW